MSLTEVEDNNIAMGLINHNLHSGLLQICDSYSLEEREYFFDRSPRNFDAILGLYRNGKLHLAAGVSIIASQHQPNIANYACFSFNSKLSWGRNKIFMSMMDDNKTLMG